jgi:diguanylate cyclase (GGDEF)-like protein
MLDRAVHCSSRGACSPAEIGEPAGYFLYSVPGRADLKIRKMATEDSAAEERQSRPAAGGIPGLLDRTQGHLILRWNAGPWARRARHTGLAVLYSLFAILFLVLFAIDSFTQQHPGHGAVLLTFALLTACCLFFLRQTGRAKITNYLLVLLLGSLCLVLLYTGGIDGSGPLWYYVFPLFALFVLRLWAGILAVLLLFIVTMLVLLLPPPGFDPSQYSGAFLMRFLAVYAAVSVMAFFYAFARASAELELSNLTASLKEMANTDVLTQSPNRRHMEELLYREIARTRRSGGVFSLVLMDLDGFKEINDRHGHDCGDGILQSVPGIAARVLRTQDICSRWGGEEFLLLLPGTSLSDAAQVAERLRAAIAARNVNCGGQELAVTASLGVSEYREDESLEGCLRRADENLYRAKKAGRNRVVA